MDASLVREVTVNPRFGRRTWVKLWVNEWLDGTTRFEMSDSQRAFWIDLLALAGRSRFPGVICAGKSPEGKYIGYPINKYQSLMSEPINVEDTLALFARTGKISIEVTSESPLRLLKLELSNWDKYQSEYHRQKPYRTRAKLHKSDTEGYNKGNKTEVEVEGEREVDKTFCVFWQLYPRKVGKAKATALWKKLTSEEEIAVIGGLKLWRQAEQWQREGGKFIPYASTFLAQRRWEDEPWAGAFEEARA